MAFTKITQYLATVRDLQKVRGESFLNYQKEIEEIKNLTLTGKYTVAHVDEMQEKAKKNYESLDAERKQKIKQYLDSLWVEIFPPAEIDSTRFVSRLNIITSIGSELSREDLVAIIDNKEMLSHQRELALLKRAAKKQGLDTKPFENFMFERESHSLNGEDIINSSEEFWQQMKKYLDINERNLVSILMIF